MKFTKLTRQAELLCSDRFNILIQNTEPKDRLHLQHKTICIKLFPLPHPLCFTFEDTVRIVFSEPPVPDAYAALSIMHVRQLQQGQAITQLIKNNTIQLEGDVLLLQHFAALLNQVQIDPYEELSKLLGDPLTYWLQQAQTNLFKTGKTFWQTKTEQWQDYIQYEVNLAPLSAEYNHFKSEMLALEQNLSIAETQLAQSTKRL